MSTMKQTMTLFVWKGYHFHHTDWCTRSRRRFSCGSQWYVGPPNEFASSLQNPWMHWKTVQSLIL